MAVRKTTNRGRKRSSPNVKKKTAVKKKKTKVSSNVKKKSTSKKKKKDSQLLETESQHGLRELFSTNEIAYLFSVTHTAVQKWGVMPVGKKGKTNLYNLREVMEHRFGSEDGEIDERKEKARLAKYSAESARLDLSVKQGKLVQVEHSQKALNEFAATVKAAVLSIPTKLSPRLDQVTARKAHKLLTEECRNVLTEASELISTNSKTS